MSQNDYEDDVIELSKATQRKKIVIPDPVPARPPVKDIRGANTSLGRWTPGTLASPASFKKGGVVRKTGLALVHKGETILPKKRKPKKLAITKKKTPKKQLSLAKSKTKR